MEQFREAEIVHPLDSISACALLATGETVSICTQNRKTRRTFLAGSAAILFFFLLNKISDFSETNLPFEEICPTDEIY